MSLSPEILSIVQEILGTVQQEEQQATLETILTAINANLALSRSILSALSDGTTGLAAIQAQIATFSATTALDFTAVLTAVAAAQQAGSPVTLPTTPPAGYGGASASDAASAVWGFQMEDLAGTVLHGLSQAWYLVHAADQMGGWPDGYSAYFRTNGLVSQYPDIIFNTDTPQPSADNIMPGDTLVSWLERELPTWIISSGEQGPDTVNVRQSGLSVEYQWVGGNAYFNFLKSQILGGNTLVGAPIWPGLSGVTLGTSQAISDGLVITGPMQGCLVDITSVPQPISYYPFGTVKSFVRAGALLFVDDDGEAEFPQPLGPQTQVILPKSMASAASAILRLPSGVIGTIQPFTIP